MTDYVNISSVRKDIDGQATRVAIVQSRFNPEVGRLLLDNCLDELRLAGVSDDNIEIYTVPGALEIPLTLSELAKSARFDSLIALGCVIRGETYHYEVVCNESARAITEMQHYFRVPVANSILTTDNHMQAIKRAPHKGRDAARVALEMTAVIRQIKSKSFKHHHQQAN